MMDRRQFITRAAATGAAASLPTISQAYSALTFQPALWRELKETDQTIVLFFRADWSLTCQIKQELIAELLIENPEFARLTFVDINWDIYGPSELAKRMKVTRRSTLVVIKNGEELARLVNEPVTHRIRDLLETALLAG